MEQINLKFLGHLAIDKKDTSHDSATNEHDLDYYNFYPDGSI